MELLFALFVVALFLNARAAFKLALDWKGMLTTLRFVRDAYARLDALPERGGARARAARARLPAPGARVPGARHRRDGEGPGELALSPRGPSRGGRHQGRGGAGAPSRHGREHGRAGPPPARDAAAVPAEAPHPSGDARPRAQGAPAQLGAAAGGAARDPRRGPRSRARLRRGERRRLDSRSRHVSLDRPGGAGRSGRARLPGHHALPRQLRPPGHPREDLRHPAIVDLHPRVDRPAHQRGQARAALRALCRPVPAPGPRAPSRPSS